MDKTVKILFISPDAKLREVVQFCLEGWGYEAILWDSHNEDIAAIKKISPNVIVIDVHSARQADLHICGILKSDFLTAYIPVITLINKRHLRSHLLDLKHGVDDYLIKPPDPLDLRIRIEMAIRRLQFSFHANPLTGLPGARVVEEILKERIKSEADFSMAYIDLDNFKSFNDAYGYLRGDGVIMNTAYILYNMIKKCGNKDDFIAHIGGDDFAFISTPDKYELICQSFIFMFDMISVFHYAPEDRTRGFIITRDRTNKLREIPLMSVSIAVVNVKKASGVNSIIQINEKIAEIKKYIKTVPGSKYMADRRNFKVEGALGFRVYNDDNKLHFYKPLGQMLLEKNIISNEQLEEALRIHWKRGVALGEILKELDFIKEEQLKEALSSQEQSRLSHKKGQFAPSLYFKDN
jgi:GGDEF domain-containing protein